MIHSALRYNASRIPAIFAEREVLTQYDRLKTACDHGPQRTAAVSFGAGLIAGAMNSVAGGGTLLIPPPPTLIWLGLNSVTANATSTVAVWPGQVSGMVGYRRELSTLEQRFLSLAISSLIGGLFGAVLAALDPQHALRPLGPILLILLRPSSS